MDEDPEVLLDTVFHGDADSRVRAYEQLVQRTDTTVDWAYAVWDRLVAGLSHRDNHLRSICSQVLAGLARSDPEQRILVDFGSLLDVTRDPKFVTARHCLQSIWKVGVAGGPQLDLVLEGLRTRWVESAAEKNGTLVRYDIQVDLVHLQHAWPELQLIRERATAWIDEEPDPKYRKKYAVAWR